MFPKSSKTHQEKLEHLSPLYSWRKHKRSRLVYITNYQCSVFACPLGYEAPRHNEKHCSWQRGHKCFSESNRRNTCIQTARAAKGCGISQTQTQTSQSTAISSSDDTSGVITVLFCQLHLFSYLECLASCGSCHTAVFATVGSPAPAYPARCISPFGDRES